MATLAFIRELGGVVALLLMISTLAVLITLAFLPCGC